MRLRVPCLALVASALCVVARAATVVCNYCFDADVIDDCHLSVRHCSAGHICFVDVKHIEYTSPTDGRSKKMTRYQMGCLFASLCRDAVNTEPGLYGLATVFRSCCCTDRCGTPDGVGRGNWSVCPELLTRTVPILTSTAEAWRATISVLTANAIVGTLVYSVLL